MATSHLERHAGGRLGWLRASVLGANDGIVSTASLILDVDAATPADPRFWRWPRTERLFMRGA
jgi:VIT1/CCC1 family predicted Fe2+/Mn2+ transporter